METVLNQVTKGITRTHVFIQTARYFCSNLTESEFSQHSSITPTQYKISWKSVHREPSCSMQTDGRTDTIRLIAALRYLASATNKKVSFYN